MGVPFVAADLVGRGGGEPDHLEPVEAATGVGKGGADSALVFAAHVDRDRPDRAAAGPASAMAREPADRFAAAADVAVAAAMAAYLNSVRCAASSRARRATARL